MGSGSYNSFKLGNMKKPTTPFSIAVQDSAKINRSFLESNGWVLQKEFPLFENYTHGTNTSLVCSIGLYGEFTIHELHWLNRTPERTFSTTNSRLTEDDYFTILRLLHIDI